MKRRKMMHNGSMSLPLPVVGDEVGHLALDGFGDVLVVGGIAVHEGGVPVVIYT